MNDVALFENALRAAVPTQPDPLIGTALVPRLAATARAAVLESETHADRRAAARTGGPRRSRPALVARVAVAVAVIPLAFAGLAFAGVDLPQPARDAFDKVGITLPNQPSKHPRKARGDGQTGGGNDVSDAAKTAPSTDQGNSAAAHRHAREQRTKARGKAVGHARGKAIGLNGATPPGHVKEPPGQTKATGPPASTGSKHTGPPPHSNAGGASDSHPSKGGGQSHPFPPQANGKAVGHSK